MKEEEINNICIEYLLCRYAVNLFGNHSSELKKELYNNTIFTKHIIPYISFLHKLSKNVLITSYGGYINIREQDIHIEEMKKYIKDYFENPPQRYLEEKNEFMKKVKRSIILDSI